jgi:hypothetical protein
MTVRWTAVPSCPYRPDPIQEKYHEGSSDSLSAARWEPNLATGQKLVMLITGTAGHRKEKGRDSHLASNPG